MPRRSRERNRDHPGGHRELAWFRKRLPPVRLGDDRIEHEGVPFQVVAERALEIRIVCAFTIVYGSSST
jgi:hypothetical protein